MAIVSSETLILFIATVLVAGSVAGALTGGVNQLSSAVGDRSGDVSEEIRTDVEIISDPGSSAVYDDTNSTVTLLVKNTGSTTLAADPGDIDVIIEGVYRTNVSTELIAGTEWRSGDVVRVTVTNITFSDTDHRIVLDINGNSETFEFRTGGA
ncbi:flagellar protein G [Halodesulfurarchaeum sp.]|uniref:flagellar protein G n=1 Tax=Halodesulfurarchaeum sp. TaxID=1980530 RepID=UPI001BC0D7FD|nr:flagellar protein G [Halodesulfurarchaeum sp.]